MATQVIRYVDTDVVGGAANGTSWANAYAKLRTGLDAAAKNIVAADEQFTFICRASAGTLDPTNVSINETWVTDATRFVEVYAADFPADGKYDSSAYRVEQTNSGVQFRIMTNYVRVHHIQLQNTVTSTNNGFGFQTFGHTGASSTYIHDCIVRAISSSSGIVSGFHCGLNTPTNIYIWNCTIDGFVNGANDDHSGIWGRYVVNNHWIFNNTVNNCKVGMDFVDDTDKVIKNNIISNCGDDIVASGLNTIDYNLGEDSDGTNSQTPLGGSWANEMVDAANGDFRLVAGGNWQYGIDNPGAGLYLDDITGATRTATWAIGAYEAPPTGGRQLVNRGGGINSILLTGRI